MKTARNLGLVCCGLICLVAATAQAESVTLANPTMAANGSRVAQWLYSGGSGGPGWGDQDRVGGDGSVYLYDQGAGLWTFSQPSALAVQPSTEYTLSFYVTGTSGANDFTAYVKDANGGASQLLYTFGGPGDAWQQLTARFTTSPTTTSVNLGFENYGGSAWNYVRIDGVSLTTTTPEPTSMVLTALGLIGLLAYAWRKRR